MKTELEKALTFTKTYYQGKRTYNEKQRRNRNIRQVVTIVGLLLLFVFGYFMMTLLLDISALVPQG
ncbi:MAG: hypothetical protein FWF05_06440 [Oscillospiraceae bacterium]|nr:hypothetical protein [Oscillospiraceae bacterium]